MVTNMLFSFQMIRGFPVIFFLLVCSLIPVWSKTTLCINVTYFKCVLVCVAAQGVIYFSKVPWIFEKNVYFAGIGAVFYEYQFKPVG